MTEWKKCKEVLCIRGDNMGDVVMSGPAIKALQIYSTCKITLLTSCMGAEAAALNPYISKVIVADLPWLKHPETEHSEAMFRLMHTLREARYDGCVIFTVYSQNPLPAAMMAYLAGIPLRLSYCRENPYDLLTHWIPDPEPFDLIRHQVQRDLDMVAAIGATLDNPDLFLSKPSLTVQSSLKMKARLIKLDLGDPYMILHPGVSEAKRMYPLERWIDCGKALAERYKMTLVVTGSQSEIPLADALIKGIGDRAVSIAGLLSLEELVGLIDGAEAVIAVNTGTAHLAAALKRPLVVLYAETNPQHVPWNCPHVVLPFSVDPHFQSKNKVIEFVNRQRYQRDVPLPGPPAVLAAVDKLLA